MGLACELGWDRRTLPAGTQQRLPLLHLSLHGKLCSFAAETPPFGRHVGNPGEVQARPGFFAKQLKAPVETVWHTALNIRTLS
jgi:hypothetical protein